MRRLVFVGPRKVDWIEAPEPELSTERSAIVRPLAVSTCDMDAVALAGAIRFRSGTPLGHEGVAVVEVIGDDVARCRVGDVVVVPWQISCGTCDRCLRGQDAYCTSVPAGSCYGWGPHVDRWGGFAATRFEVPFADHMLVPVPDGLAIEAATGLSDNLVDAWRAVGPPLAETAGRRVLVVGSNGDDGGSIGVYAAAFAVASGCEEVVFASRSEVLRSHAERYGADVLQPDDTRFDEQEGFDVVVDASGDPGLLAQAVSAAGVHAVATCTAGAVHRGADVPMPIYSMYMNSVTLRTGWVSTRPLIAEPLTLTAAGAVDPTALATTVSIDDAVAAFAEPFTKLILTGSP